MVGTAGRAPVIPYMGLVNDFKTKYPNHIDVLAYYTCSLYLHKAIATSAVCVVLRFNDPFGPPKCIAYTFAGYLSVIGTLS